MKSGAELIAEERQRQIEAEGYTAEHDDKHTGGQLALAGAAYAVAPDTAFRAKKLAHCMVYSDLYPFENRFDGRANHGELRRLAIAGALIAAEIDRVIRLRSKENAGK